MFHKAKLFRSFFGHAEKISNTWLVKPNCKMVGSPMEAKSFYEVVATAYYVGKMTWDLAL